MTTRSRRSLFGLLLALLTIGFAGGTGAQSDIGNSILLRVSACPVGMSADTFVASECSPIIDGFDVRIDSLTGIMAPLTLADATLEGDSFVWDNEVIVNRGAYDLLSIRETLLPAGFTDYLVEGSGVEVSPSGYWTFSITSATPTPVLTIYNFAAARATPGVAPAEASPGSQPSQFSAAIAVGPCAEPAEEVGTPLGSPAVAVGDREGSAIALAVAVSFSTVDVSLDTLLGSEHAVVIRVPDGSAGAESILACGEIGGARQLDGTLAVGLRDAGQSGVSGVAYLAPLPENPDQTGVSLFVVSEPADKE